MKETAKAEVEDAKEYIYDNYFAPIFGFLSTLASLVLLIIVVGCLLKFKVCKKKRPSMIVGGLMQPQGISSRSECSI